MGQNFNTSYVSINPDAAKGENLHRNISIHLMFLLIFKASMDAVVERVFQYISCFY